jgi:hypothetical protein
MSTSFNWIIKNIHLQVFWEFVGIYIASAGSSVTPITAFIAQLIREADEMGRDYSLK